MSGRSLFLKRAVYPLLLILCCIMTNSLAANAMTGANSIAANVVTPAVDCSDPNQAQSAICTTSQNPDPIYGSGGIFDNITNIISIIAGGAAIIILLVGSIRFITSGGDANKVSSAKSTIVGALIGIAVIVLARTLINYVVNRL
jgi:hypothetical protein